jgi:hypothetical protein
MRYGRLPDPVLAPRVNTFEVREVIQIVMDPSIQDFHNKFLSRV